MAEPNARAGRIDTLFPWLRHWSIGDERIGGFRSDAYALDTADGLILIDALPLEAHLEAQLENVKQTAHASQLLKSASPQKESSKQ